MRASSSLRLALFASLALAASAAKCAYSCDASASPESVCHASCRPVFALCGPGQTCTSEFHLGDGVDAVTGASFAYGTAAGSVRGGVVGGDASCDPTGCSRESVSLTFQSEDLGTTWNPPSAACEILDVAARCPFPAPPPLAAPLTRVTAKLKCRNTVLPCANFRASVVVDFDAEVAWASPPPPPPAHPAASPPPSPPPAPPGPPPAPAAWAEGGVARRALRDAATVCAALVVLYAVLGFAFVRAKTSGRLRAGATTWAQRLTPWRCDEELFASEGAEGGAGGPGARRECELLWCWCVPPHWRHSEEDVMDEYYRGRGYDLVVDDES